MCIIRFVLLLVLCSVFSIQVKAQTEQFATPVVEYGDLSELAGKRRVFVHSENLESRAKIVKALEKSKYPYFEVVGRIADADFLLIYGTNLVRNNTTSFTEASGDVTVVYGDLVVLTLNSSPKLSSNRKTAPVLSAANTRIVWYTRKRRMLIRTNQFFRLFQPALGGSKSSAAATIIGNIIFSHPKLAWLPLRGNTEKAAVRQFIKALRKADESPKPDKRVTLPLLTKPAPVFRKRVLRKPVPAPRRRQRFRRKL